MVTRKNLKRNALISVYDKSGLSELCKSLEKFDINIISTGSTAINIRKLGFKCQNVSRITRFKEILDGRVKTLQPKIHASILYNRQNKKHEKTFKDLNFPKIDFVIVNFYPFSKISNNIQNFQQKIEMIDIGGPSLIRSASKNFQHVTPICSRFLYKKLIKELEANKGFTNLSFRLEMAKECFKKISDYDLSIFEWLSSNSKKNEKKNTKINLKYGENPNQNAFFIKKSNNNIISNQIYGKKIGYNNILDINEGFNCINDFKETTCVIIKHNNPCGVASSSTIKQAFIKAQQADPVSAFGGAVLLNRKIDEKLAKLIAKYFIEIIVAPGYTKKSLSILSKKKNLIIINSKGFKRDSGYSLRSINSGLLYQEINNNKILSSKFKNVSTKKVSKKILDDLVFAFKVAKHLKSNAIVLVKNKQTVGIGCGQMSRLDSTKIAIMKYKKFFKNQKFVCASDAFFPFTDNIKILSNHKCIAIAQPPGSKNDNLIIKYANKKQIPLYFFPQRVFKH
jgi:phosphoribosylaminoimidazolecarboxamide formyltransferase / IMP cyclohydrolase